MEAGIVICSRLSSSRVPRKAFSYINGEMLITHLLTRMDKLDLPVVMACPDTEKDEWRKYYRTQTQFKNVSWVWGSESDPLDRMYRAAKEMGLKKIIRITHDKILVDPDLIFRALGECNRNCFDYGYSTGMVDGTGFEIIDFDLLEKAARKYKGVEHISYALKTVCDESKMADLVKFGISNQPPLSQIRFLVDYPEDTEYMNILLATLGNDVSPCDAIEWAANNWDIGCINRLPDVTVYTCAYNAEKWIPTCITSVLKQEGVEFEYLIVDDFSSDETPKKIGEYLGIHRGKMRYIRNPENIGLASSSNVALSRARGKYIVRLDADDFFAKYNALETLVNTITDRGLDVVYPANYLGDYSTVQSGDCQHHVGGAVFRTAALNHLKFTDRLRGLEGYDLYLRAKEVLDIGYLAKPIFFYRQHENSMSKTNLDERQKLKKEIEERNGAQMASN